MTNEQLVQEIKDGDKDLIPILYQRVKGLLFKLSGEYFSRYKDRFTACGVEFPDLRQECYPAFLKAVEQYDNASGYMFTSYLNYPIRNAGAELLGIRNKDRINTMPLDNCTSLDKPLDNGEGEGGTLLDVVADSTSEQPFEDVLQSIEDEETKQALTNALAKLTEQQRDVLIKLFFEEITQEQCGKIYGLSGERIRQIKAKALRQLRADKDLCLLRAEQNIERTLHFDSRANNRAYYEAQEQIQAIIQRGSYLTYGQRQAIMFDCMIRQRALQEEEHKQKYEQLTDSEKHLAKLYEEYGAFDKLESLFEMHTSTTPAL